MTKVYEFRVMQAGTTVAGAFGQDRDVAEGTALSYMQGYLDDAHEGDIILIQEKIKGRWKTTISCLAQDDT